MASASSADTSITTSDATATTTSASATTVSGTGAGGGAGASTAAAAVDPLLATTVGASSRSSSKDDAGFQPGVRVVKAAGSGMKPTSTYLLHALSTKTAIDSAIRETEDKVWE